MGGVVRRYIYRYPHNITYPYYSTCISFFCSSISTSSFLFMLFLCNRANVAQRTFEIIQISRSREYNKLYLQECARALTTSPETSTCEVPR